MRSTIIRACILLIVMVTMGCDLVSLDTPVEGVITFDDEYDYGSTAYTASARFYYDAYTFKFEKGVTYNIELWCPSGMPVFFNLYSQNMSFLVWGDDDDDTYSIKEYTAPISDYIEFTIYLRFDYMDQDVPYSFMISEK